MSLFQERKQIGENLATFIRLKGYSKSSFAKLINLSRPTLDKILEGESTNIKKFEEQIEQITSSLNLSKDYFLQKKMVPLEKWQLPAMHYSDRSSTKTRQPNVQQLLNDLDDLLDIAAIYL